MSSNPKPYASESYAADPGAPTTPPTPIEWVSWDFYLAIGRFGLSPKNNPIVLTALGRIRFRVRENGTSDPWQYGDWSDFLGPGTGNQPSGLQSQVVVTPGVIYEIEVRLESGDPAYASTGYEYYGISFAITTGGPFYLPSIP